MIHGCFFFVRGYYDVGRGVQIVSTSPSFRNQGQGPISSKETIVRNYLMITGNNLAASPYLVVTPGIRPMTSCVEPWLHMSIFNGGGDGCPMYRERLTKITIEYGDNGVATAVAETMAQTPTVWTGVYYNNLPMYPVPWGTVANKR